MKKQLNKFKNLFSEEGLWAKLKNYARQAGVKVVYTVLLLFYAYRRKDTPAWAKNIILGALGYFLAPIDAIPDLSPIIGYTDDIGVLSFGLVTIAAYVNQEVRDKAKGQLSKWFGEIDASDLAEVDEQL